MTDIPLNEVILVEAIAEAATGAAVDADSTPTFAVFEETTDTDIGVGGNMTKRTSLTGNYRAQVSLSAANGFEVGKCYSVVGSAMIGGVATKGVLLQFRVVAAETIAGEPKTDVASFGGTAGTFSSGRPEVIAQSVSDKTGFSLTSAYDAAKTAAQAGDAMALIDNAITAAKIASDALAAIAASVEAAILDEGDATPLLAAISAKVEEFLLNEGDASATLAAIGTAVRTALATELARIDVATSTRSGHDAAAVKAAMEADGSKLDHLWEMTEDDGGTRRLTTNALEQAPTAGGMGTGARTIVITVDDETDPLQSARVRVTKGAENYVGSTDASGEITFSLDDGTWSVAISLAGYQFTPVSLVVSGDETETYSMTAVTLTPSEPTLTTGYLTVYDEFGEPEPGVVIYLRAKAAPSTYGFALDTEWREETSDANGVVEFSNLFPGAQYLIGRSATGAAMSTTIPLNASATVALPSLVGAP